MFNAKSASNIIHNTLGNNSILAECSKNLFYSLLQTSSGYSLIENTKQPFIAAIYDNPISLSQQIQNININYHVNAIVFIHSRAPDPLKKEDKYILSEKLNSVTKIFFSKEIQDSWSLKNNIYLIPYGVKLLNTEKTKNILLINTSKNSNIDKLYAYTKNIYNDCDILYDIIDYDLMIDYISQYKIVISLENTYDSLVGAASGCYVISNNLKDNNLPSVIYLNNFTTIVHTIQSILNFKNDNSIEISKSYIQENYPINKFYASIKDIFLNCNNKVFTYAT